MRTVRLLVCALLLASGCGSSTGGPLATDTPAAPPHGLVGQWTNTCERGTLKVLDLRSDGTFRLEAAPLGSPLAEVSTGTYHATAEMLEFLTDSFCGQPATYSWEQDGEAITFQLDEDACSARAAVLDGYVFTPLAFPRLADAMTARGRSLEQVVREYEAAWNTGDPEAIGAFLSQGAFLFTEPGTTVRSADEFVAMMTPYMSEAVGARDVQVFVGDGEVLEAYQTWGFGGATPDDPVAEVDVFTIADTVITEIHTMYGVEFLAGVGMTVPTAVVDRYVAAWSSGDGDEIGDLYAEDAVRTEGLYATSIAGRRAIQGYATAFTERHPGVTLSIVDPYIFGHGGTEPVVGAVVDLVADGCQLPLAVLLEVNESETITTERLFYDLAALAACGWQR